MFTIRLIIFIVGTVAILWISRQSLAIPRSHSFTRFFAWEAILILLALNLHYWLINPFSPTQLIAWTLLIISLTLILIAVRQFQHQGQLDPNRTDDPALVGIEKTTQLVTTGLYRYIRHPFYSSLLFLAWGIFFKHPGWLPAALAVTATLFLFFTARREEQENIAFFGEPYRDYMQHTKMFIPYIF